MGWTASSGEVSRSAAERRSSSASGATSPTRRTGPDRSGVDRLAPMDASIWFPAATALVGVVVGTLLSEYLAGRREDRAEARRAAAERGDRLRVDRLDEIDQTMRAISALFARMTGLAAGDATAAATPVGQHVYPRLNFRLINDVNVIRLYTATAADLATRPPGSGLTVADVEKVATVETAVGEVLDAQRRRVLLDEPGLELDLVELLKYPEVAQTYAALLSGTAAPA